MVSAAAADANADLLWEKNTAEWLTDSKWKAQANKAFVYFRVVDTHGPYPWISARQPCSCFFPHYYIPLFLAA
jgi:hypothetical protein